MTLIEVVLATALLATLLAGLLIADSQLALQSGRARRHIEACRIADEMLEAWWPKRWDIPRNGSGDVPDHEDWRWRTETVTTNDLKFRRGQIIALEIFYKNQSNQADGEPTVRVEFLIYDENGAKK